MKEIGRRNLLLKGIKVLPALAVIGMAAAASARPVTNCEGCADACFSTCKDNCESTCKGNCTGDCSGSSKGS